MIAKHPRTPSRRTARIRFIAPRSVTTKCRAWQRCRSERGTAFVEFVLLLPLIIILLLGIAAFGFALNGWIDEIQLTAESARMAAVDSEHGEGEVKPASFLKWITEQGDSSYIREAKATMCSPTSAVGDYVRIKMTYNYKWLGLGGLLGTSVETPLESNAYMRVEQAPPKEAAYSTTC